MQNANQGPPPIRHLWQTLKEHSRSTGQKAGVNSSFVLPQTVSLPKSIYLEAVTKDLFKAYKMDL